MLQYLYKCISVGLLLTTFVSVSQAQTIISNIRTDYTPERMKITYDLEKINPEDSIFIKVESRVKGDLLVKTVTGDVGKNVALGSNKVIYWDYKLDDIRITEHQIRVHILASNPAIKTVEVGRGPVSALASLVLPGVGNMLVSRKIGLRPLISVSYIGLLGYGYVQRKKSHEQIDLYNNAEFDYEPTAAESHYQQANKHRRKFYYAAQGAALILAADVIYSVVKGIQNDRLKRSQSRISLHYIGNTPALAYQLTF